VYANLDKMSEKIQSLFNSFINDIKVKINETFNASLLTKETQSKSFNIINNKNITIIIIIVFISFKYIN